MSRALQPVCLASQLHPHPPLVLYWFCPGGTGARWRWEDPRGHRNASYNTSFARGSVCHWLDSETAGNNLPWLLCSKWRGELPPSSMRVGVATRLPGSLFLLPGCLPCLEDPISPLSLLYKKRDFSWGSSSSVQKLGSFKAAVLPLGIRDVNLPVGTGASEQLHRCFPKWVDGDGTFTTCGSWFSSLPIVHWPLKTPSTVFARREALRLSPCVLLSSSGCVAQNTWLRSSWQVQAPRNGCGPPLLWFSCAGSTPQDCVPVGFWKLSLRAL